MGISLSGLSSGMDTDSIIKEMMKAQNIKVDKLTKAKTKIEMKKDVWKDVNKKIMKFYNGSLNNLKMQGTFLAKKASVLNTNAGSATATIGAQNGVHDIKVVQLATSSSIASSSAIRLPGVDGSIANASTKLSELMDEGQLNETKFVKIQSTVNGEEKVIELTEDETLASLTKKIAEADSNLIVSYEEKYGRLIIKSKETGADNKVTLTALKSSDVNDIDVTSSLFSNLKIGESGVAQGEQGKNAIFNYNGINGMESSSNQIEVGGIKFNAYTEGVSTSIIVDSNTDEIYNAVKAFVKEYNEVLQELNDRAYSGVAKGYEPLTKEEKSSMAESDIKLWEEAVKNGLLNRDSTAVELIDTMRNVMTTNAGVDTSKMQEPYTTLSSIGIGTYVWQERGLLHIDGDTEDAIGAMNEDKLRKAIEENPTAVMELLNGLGKALSNQLSEKMASVSNVKSAFTFYNDKLMDKEIATKAEEINIMNERMTLIEARYRSQFTAMEKAMSASNATSSWLTKMLG